ncbi:MAG: hypothetical protein KC912_22770 [Proteobacteria bacterium]|nr:hypothetical protein [Pseudomonadota bacterium]
MHRVLPSLVALALVACSPPSAELVRPLSGAVQVSPFHPVAVQADADVELTLAGAEAEYVDGQWWLTPTTSLAPGQVHTVLVNGVDRGLSFTTAELSSRQVGTVAEVIAEVDDARSASGSALYDEPTSAEQDAFAASLERMLDGDWDVDTALAEHGYRWDALTEPGRIVVWEATPTSHRGAFLFDFAADSGLVIQAPHPEYDTHTGEQAGDTFIALEASALFVSGAHRCTSPDASACSGTTSACGSTAPFKISDAAHSDQSFFQTAHEVTATHWPDSVAVQLHGFGWDGNEPAAYVSDGVAADDAGSIANTVRDALNAELPSTYTAASCADASETTRLCGTTNTQGRFSNASPETCATAASVASNRFVHLEQARDLRDNQREPIIAALRSLGVPVPDLR